MPNNPFGMDFSMAGHQWTTALCKKDSDGDGLTNGEELGDPCCLFNTGYSVPTTYKVSHPGSASSVSSSTRSLAVASAADTSARSARDATALNSTEMDPFCIKVGQQFVYGSPKSVRKAGQQSATCRACSSASKAPSREAYRGLTGDSIQSRMAGDAFDALRPLARPSACLAAFILIEDVGVRRSAESCGKSEARQKNSKW